MCTSSMDESALMQKFLRVTTISKLQPHLWSKAPLWKRVVVSLLMGQNSVAGLFLAALGTQMAASASRWMPEPLSFVMKVFTQIINDTQSSQKTSPAPIFSFRNSQSDQIGKESRRHSSNSSNIPSEEPAKLKFDFRGSEDSREDLSESCSIAAVELLDRIASQNEGLLSLPEALIPALNSLQQLQKQATLPKVSQKTWKICHVIHCTQLMKKITIQCTMYVTGSAVRDWSKKSRPSRFEWRSGTLCSNSSKTYTCLTVNVWPVIFTHTAVRPCAVRYWNIWKLAELFFCRAMPALSHLT